MTTYHFALGSERFFCEEEPLEEVLRERVTNYKSREKEIDFWLVKQPAFLEAPSMKSFKDQCPQPAAAVISTNKKFITFLKLRMEFVLIGEFEAPSDAIADPLASLATAA